MSLPRPHTPGNIKAKYETHSLSFESMKTPAGDYAHLFANEADAQKFLDWLQSLDLSDGEKFQIKEISVQNEIFYLVNLSPTQYKVVSTPAAGSSLEIHDLWKRLYDAINLSTGNHHENPSDKLPPRLMIAEIKIYNLIANLLETTSRAQQLELMKMRDKNGRNLLAHAASSKRALAFSVLQDNLYREAFSSGLSKRDKLQNTTMHYVLAELTPEIAIAAMRRAYPETINKILPRQTHDKSSVFDLILDSQAEEVVLGVIDGASTACIDQLLQVQDVMGNTILHKTAFSHFLQVSLSLIQKASPAALNLALAKKNKLNFNILHAIASQESSPVCEALLAKISNAALDRALTLRAHTLGTGLEVVLHHLPPALAQVVIQRASNQSLNTACRNHQSILENILSYQSPTVTAELLQRLDDITLRRLLGTGNTSSRVCMYVAGNIMREPAWQQAAFVSRLLKIQGALAMFCAGIWSHGNDFPPAVLALVLPMLPKIAEQLRVPMPDFNGAPYIMTSCGSRFSLLDTKPIFLARAIWYQGLASDNDYRVLRKYLPCSLATQVASDLKDAGLLETGCFADYNCVEANQDFEEILEQGNALLKVIRPENEYEFFKQLKEYSYRPRLRDGVNQEVVTHKFIHLRGVVEPYKFHGLLKNKDSYTETKKHSVTALSAKLTTPVYGQQHAGQPLVSILFDKSKTTIKAMFREDRGTQFREWVGTKKDMQKYIKKMLGVLFTDFEAFKKMVDENPWRFNELLVRLSREAMLAIVIITDDEVSRKIARKWRGMIKELFFIDLPIIFYNNFSRSLGVYTERAQYDAEYAAEYKTPGFKSLKVLHDKAEERLSAELQDIRDKIIHDYARIPYTNNSEIDTQRKTLEIKSSKGHLREAVEAGRKVLALYKEEINKRLLKEIKKTLEEQESWQGASFFANDKAMPACAKEVLNIIARAEREELGYSQALEQATAIIEKSRLKCLFPDPQQTSKNSLSL